MAEVEITFEVTETRHYTWSGDVSELPSYIYRRIDGQPDTWEETISDNMDMDEIRSLISSDQISYGDDEDDYEVLDITINAPTSDDEPASQDQDPTGGPVTPGRCPVCSDTACDCDCASCTLARKLADQGAAAVMADLVATAKALTADVAPESVPTVRTSPRPF